MKSPFVPVITVSLMLSCFTLRADVIKLKDGRAVQGIFLGGNSRQIDILDPGGRTLSFPITSLASVVFMSLPEAAPAPGAPGAPAPAGASAGAAPVARPAVLISANTLLRVRTIDAIDVDSSAAGA